MSEGERASEQAKKVDSVFERERESCRARCEPDFVASAGTAGLP